MHLEICCEGFEWSELPFHIVVQQYVVQVEQPLWAGAELLLRTIPFTSRGA